MDDVYDSAKSDRLHVAKMQSFWDLDMGKKLALFLTIYW